MIEKKIQIGYIAKAHSIKGEVFLRLLDKEDSFMAKGMDLYIREKVFEVQNLRRAKDGLIIKLNGVDTRNDSELLKSSEVFVLEDVFKPKGSEDSTYLNQMMGYQIYLDGALKGKVVGFAETAAHDLLRVEISEREEIEIPYVDSFISNIDHLENRIDVDCPPELFDFSFISGAKK